MLDSGSTATLQHHIDRLVAGHRLTRLPLPAERIDQYGPFLARAFPETRTIEVPDVLDEETYYMNLHEIGHCVGQFQGRDYCWLTMEIDADLWAFEHSDICFSELIYFKRLARLRNHIIRLLIRHGVADQSEAESRIVIRHNGDMSLRSMKAEKAGDHYNIFINDPGTILYGLSIYLEIENAIVERTQIPIRRHMEVVAQ